MNARETLNKIRQEYMSKGDVIFRTALMNVVDCGQQSYNNEEWYNEMLKEIDDRHDKIEAEGKFYFMTRDFEKAIMECSKAIAAVDTHSLLKYIQQNVWLGGDFGEPDYQEAIELLQSCMRHIEDSKYTLSDVLDAFYDVGLSDEQIGFLGFEHLLDVDN